MWPFKRASWDYIQNIEIMQRSASSADDFDFAPFSRLKRQQRRGRMRIPQQSSMLTFKLSVMQHTSTSSRALSTSTVQSTTPGLEAAETADLMTWHMKPKVDDDGEEIELAKPNYTTFEDLRKRLGPRDTFFYTIHGLTASLADHLVADDISLDADWSSVTRCHNAGAGSKTKEVTAVHISDLYLARCDLVMAHLFGGFKALLGLLTEEQRKDLILPILQLTDGLYKAIFPWPELWASTVLLKTWLEFSELFQISLILESHQFSLDQVPEHVPGKLLENLVSSIALAATDVRKLSTLYSQRILGAWHRRKADEIHSCINAMRRLQASGDHESTEWKKYRASVTHIESMEDDAGLGSIAQANQLWNQVGDHADEAAMTLASSFEDRLNRPDRRLADMVEATTPVLLGAVMQKLMHMPALPAGGDAYATDAHAMYVGYMAELGTEVWTGYPDRERINRLRYPRYELDAYSLIQATQLRTMRAFYDQVEPQFGKLEHDRTNPAWQQAAHALHCYTAQPREQINDIQEMDKNIKPLHDECRAQIQSIEDWRNNAAVVFTVVTVIFLPLSFVASLYGMNTADIRDTRLNQWVYWAAALPLTTLVAVTTLLLVEVPPLRRWRDRREEEDNIGRLKDLLKPAGARSRWD